jgi:TorA maturation chaperone TorD
MNLDPEDLARADLYGVLARLFYAAPDAPLLWELGQRAAGGDGSGEQDTGLAHAWRALGEACAGALPADLQNEHTDIFVGAGRAEVTPYLSHYLVRSQADAPLVALRARLQQWGLARRGDVFEPEDHISGLCEVMRFAIAVQHRSLDEQRNFFETNLYPGAVPFLEAVTKSEKARLYKRVAELARVFFEIEREAFSMA